MPPKQDPPLHTQMLNLAFGHFRTQAIYVAARLGIADLLKDGPRTTTELAGLTGAHAASLYRLLRALAGIGIFAEDDEGRFGLTPLATTLESGSPASVLPAVLLGGSEFHWDSWSNLLHSVMTGESAFEHVHGARFFDYLSANPDAEAVFAAWMTRSSELNNPAIVTSYDFWKFRTIVDVGGGEGSLLAAVLRANPAAHGILFDLPGVIEAAQRGIAVDLPGRVDLVRGSFFDLAPRGGDLYLLKTVIHDWNDELSIRILRNCREAMSAESRLLVIESVIPSGNEPHFSKFMDLNMLVLNHGGRERTEAEYRSLFRSAGLELTQVIPTPSPFSVLESVRARVVE